MLAGRGTASLSALSSDEKECVQRSEREERRHATRKEARMTLPKVVSQEEWTAARRTLLERRRTSPASATASTPSAVSYQWSR